MIRPSTVLFVFLGLCLGAGLFQLKYLVMGLEKEAKTLHRSLKETKERIHLLKAEWAHLNSPKRLQVLSERFLTISPLKASQIISMEIDAPLKRGGNQQGKTPQKTAKKEVLIRSQSPSYDHAALEQLVSGINPQNPRPSKGRLLKGRR